ncbi:MAG: aminodeoxychorismate lyase [Idiomarina sp.]|nr:aminodeoxychorismate lyase [Idiomarina sp.]
MTQFLLNSKLACSIDIADRGLQYGDGFFTTIRVLNGALQLWPLHWQRLATCAERLGFAGFNTVAMQAQLSADSEQLLSMQPVLAEELVLRITVTRGAGGRGYTPPQDPSYNVLLSLSPMPQSYPMWRAQGVTLALSQQRLGDQPMLNGLKTLNRLEQVLLKQELSQLQQQGSPDDLLVLDQRGHIAESTAANLIWKKAGQWYTPALQHGGVKGVMCQSLQQQHRINAGDYPLMHLLEAEQVYLCNSLMGVVGVKQLRIDATTVHHFSVLSQACCELTKRIGEDE